MEKSFFWTAIKGLLVAFYWLQLGVVIYFQYPQTPENFMEWWSIIWTPPLHDFSMGLLIAAFYGHILLLSLYSSIVGDSEESKNSSIKFFATILVLGIAFMIIMQAITAAFIVADVMIIGGAVTVGIYHIEHNIQKKW